MNLLPSTSQVTYATVLFATQRRYIIKIIISYIPASAVTLFFLYPVTIKERMECIVTMTHAVCESI